MATRDERRPIVMFTNDNDMRPMNDAVAAGVTAYIVAGLAPERITKNCLAMVRLMLRLG